MRDHARGWNSVGGGLLLAAASHGWNLLLGVAVILVVTYLAAIVLLHELKSRNIEWATIITPFLTIRAGLSNHDNATSTTDSKVTVSQPGAIKQHSDGDVAGARQEKRPADTRTDNTHTNRTSTRLSPDRHKPSLLARKSPITLP